MRMSIGVDLHKTQFTYCCLSEDRKAIRFDRQPTIDLGYQLFEEQILSFANEGYEVSIAVESTGNTRYFINKIIHLEVDIKVVNTLKFKVVNESVKKTDKHDARTLAEFLEKDMLPESCLCSQYSEDLRRMLKSRSILVKSIISIKNQIHALLMSYGIETARGQLQSKKERQRILKGLADHRIIGNAAKTVQPLLDTIDNLCSQVKELEKVIKELVGDDPNIDLLQTIPGVGLITAVTIMAYTDDIDRYDTAKKYSSHAGLVPWVQNSNMTIHHGHITKRGPVELRTALVQAVMGMIRCKKKCGDFRIMTKYQSMKKNKGSGQSIIATARKLSSIIYYMLKFQKPFDVSKMLDSDKYKEMQATAFNVANAS